MHTQIREKFFNSLHPGISVLVSLQLDIRILSSTLHKENCSVKLIISSVTLEKDPCCQKLASFGGRMNA